MPTTTDLEELLKTVELIRGEMHPDLDRRFLEAVVRAEEEHPEEDLEAIRAIQAALKATLVSSGVT